MQKICGVHFFYFAPEKPFLDKSGEKTQNCQLKQKFGAKTNLNKWISMMVLAFLFFFFLTSYIFFGQIWSKNSKFFVQNEI